MSDVIVKCRQFGNAVTSMLYNEQLFVVGEDGISTTSYIPRETIRRVSTPQAYKFSLIDEKYHEAFATGTGIHGSSYANTLMSDLGVKLYFAAGSDKNVKLTTREDLEWFKAYLRTNTDGGQVNVYCSSSLRGRLGFCGGGQSGLGEAA